LRIRWKIALIRFQEGARIVGDKVELKGLAMKKTTVAKSTGKYFEKSIEDRVLRPAEVDRRGILRDLVELEGRIRASITAGGTEYSQPLALGRIADYADKHAMPVVRGSTAWNLAFPDDPIREGDRVNAFKIRVGTDASIIAEEIAQWEDGSPAAVALRAIVAAFFDPTDPDGFSKNGFNWLCVPKEHRTLPEWAVRLVDVESVVQANVTPVFPIFESLGMKMLRLPQPETYSNIVAF
jgi:hypothetical protein